MKSIISMFMVFVLCIVTIGCNPTTSNLIMALNAVSDASSVAVVITSSLVAMGKLDPTVATQVSVYAQGVSAAVSTSVTELNSSDPNPQKITVITAAFAKVAAPAFSNAPAVSAAIDAVSAVIKIFLNNLTSAGVLKVAKAAPVAPLTLTHGDKVMLKQILKKNAETQATALKLAK